MLACRPEFLPIMGSRKAVNAQDESREGFFRSLFSPTEIAALCPLFVPRPALPNPW
jgi:hypothetical protein